jgi:hypothetical protein
MVLSSVVQGSFGICGGLSLLGLGLAVLFLVVPVFGNIAEYSNRALLPPDVKCVATEIRERLQSSVRVRMGMRSNAVGFYMVFLTLFCGLRVTLHKALKTTCNRDREDWPFPAISVISFANGVDKIFLMVLGVVVRIFKQQYLKMDTFPKYATDYYAPLVDSRDRGILALRPTYVLDDMKASNSIPKELFPFTSISAMDNNKCYRQIDIPSQREKVEIEEFPN